MKIIPIVFYNRISHTITNVIVRIEIEIHVSKRSRNLRGVLCTTRSSLSGVISNVAKLIL